MLAYLSSDIMKIKNITFSFTINDKIVESINKQPMKNRRLDNQNSNNYQLGYMQGYREVISTQTTAKKKSHKFRHFVILLVLITIASGVVYSIKGSSKTISYQSISNSIQSVNSKSIKTTINECIDNVRAKEVVVVLNKQHLWACNYQKAIFNSAVVTGYTGSPSNITPVGTYHIFKKFTNINLTGSDDMGSWNVHVSYWMPFLFNQYGAYGFHDATWRTPKQFGHINTATKNASHGCVELPLATAKWLYSWLNIGSTVSIRAT
jgi:lipoprotein-anchoring transpeptidase ErfK/SrfK